MRIPFIGRFLSSSDEDSSPKLGSQKNIKHNANVIVRHLTKYAQENHLLTVQTCLPDGLPNKKAGAAHTGIITLDEKKKTIAFDQFSPSNLEENLQSGDRLHFSLTHEGTYFQFTCQYQKTVQTKSGHAHIVKFPLGVENTQLRDAYRVGISQATPIKISLLHTSNPVISGNVVDLSAKGVRMKLAGLIEPKPKRGEEYLSCQLVLTDGYSMHSGAKLMHWIYDAKSNCTYLGIKFTEMDGSNERVLNRYITQLQRKIKHGEK